MENKFIEKSPEAKWYYFLPFAPGKKEYKIDRERYDNQFLTKVQLIRKKQNEAINSVSGIIIAGITLLWTLLPPMTELPSWLEWMNMGMNGFGSQNWGNQFMLTVVPGVGGFTYHHFPKIIPNKAIRTGVNIAIKLLPIIILIFSWYLIHTEKQIRIIKKEKRDA